MSSTKRTLADETAAANKRQRLDAASVSSGGGGVRTVSEILNDPCGYYLSKVSCSVVNRARS
jgi:hypothetical protein